MAAAAVLPLPPERIAVRFPTDLWLLLRREMRVRNCSPRTSTMYGRGGSWESVPDDSIEGNQALTGPAREWNITFSARRRITHGAPAPASL